MAKFAESSSSGSIGAPIDRFVGLIRGRYKADIVIMLGKGARRFSELRRSINRISDRAPARQLDELEHDAIVRRVAYAEVPPRVIYSLTPYGRNPLPITRGDLEARSPRWSPSTTRSPRTRATA
jgi:DNA-binding HxlR family transcriptional regulator